jgi:hypothetical protein
MMDVNRNLFDDPSIDATTCLTCGSSMFRFDRATGDLVCYACGRTVTLDKSRLYQIESGKTRAKKGIKSVLANADPTWKARALNAVRVTAADREYFTADHIHKTCFDLAVPPPHHPNAWGGIVRKAMNDGLMRKTGRFVASQRPNQNGTMIPLYESLAFRKSDPDFCCRGCGRSMSTPVDPTCPVCGGDR